MLSLLLHIMGQVFTALLMALLSLCFVNHALAKNGSKLRIPLGPPLILVILLGMSGGIFIWQREPSSLWLGFLLIVAAGSILFWFFSLIYRWNKKLQNTNMSDIELNSESPNVFKVSVAKSANAKYYLLILLYCFALLGISIYWPYITDVYPGRPTMTKPVVEYHIVTYWGLWERIPDKVFVNQYNNYVRVIKIDYLRLAISYVIATASAVSMYALIKITTFFRK